MNETSIVHADFTVEHRYDLTRDRVFTAWADPVAKARWFAPSPSRHSLDFRVGGEERVENELPDGREITFDSNYQDIVADQRIVYTSRLATDGRLATVSVTTVEFEPDGDGTLLVLTEQDVFLDGQELPDWREQGTRGWMEKLRTELIA